LLTLNEIHAQIVALANAHYQIAEVGMGTIAELQGKPDRLYPLLWLSNEGGSLEDNYKVDNIRLTMFGRVIVGEEGQDDDASEIEVLSDMQLILLDFLNYFHQQHGQEYVTDKAATLEHFTERTNDRTAGYSCVLELKQFYDWNKCNIPQSGAVIPPTIDGLTLYDFCDQATIDRLTATQIACLDAEFGNCADATVQLNGTTVGTVASGATGDFPVNLDGSPSGVWDGTAWQVTSAPCADATVELNGVEMTTIPSGDTENISIRQSSGATEVGSKQGVHWRIDDSAISINGSPVADVKAEDSLDIDVTQDGSPVGSWNGSAWIVPTPIVASLSIGVYSDAGHTIPITEADFGETIYLLATPSAGYTPTEYLFFFDGVDDAIENIYHGANNSTSWVVSGTFGVGRLQVDATDDGVNWIGNDVDFEVLTALLLDDFPTCNGAFSVRKLRSLYTGSCMNVRRSSDSATQDIGFVNEELDTASIVSFVGVGNGFDAIWYDQTGTGDASQITANDQPFIAISGAVTIIGGKPTVTFTTSREFMSMTARTVISGFVVERKASNTNTVQYLIGGTGQGLSSGGTFGGSNNITLFTSGGQIDTTVNDTINHQVSFNCGAAGTASIYVDGTLAASGTTSASMTISVLGSRPDSTSFAHVGSISEIILFPDNQIANRAVIEANQQSYFGTP
jgi:hypothetical protein